LPAALIPVILAVSVVAIAQMKSGFFPSISSRKACALSSLQESSTSKLFFMAGLTFYFGLTA
jgi:preprotein translocase subunit SecY